jgi:hypothetical protein
MREWVVLAETDLLDGLTHSMVEYVTRGFIRGILYKDALSIYYLITSSSRFTRRFKFSL